MKWLTIALLLMISGYNSFCQNITLSGYIKDEKQLPLSNVTVSVPYQYAWATADSNGHYVLVCDQADTLQVVVDATGYDPVNKTFYTGKDAHQSQIRFDYVFNVFEKTYATLNDVVISGKPVAAKDKNLITLSSLDVKTTPGSNADIVSAMKALPGVNQATSQNGLLVRGGTGDETKIYMDGLLINNFFQSGTPDVSQRGRFPPDFFKNSSLAMGAYPANYGQAVSSVLLLETNDLPVSSSVDINPSTVGINTAANLLFKNRSSVGITLSYLNTGPYFNWVPQKYDFRQSPRFLDGSFNYIKKIKNGYIKFLSSNGYSSLHLYRPNLENDNLKDEYSNKNKSSFNSLTLSNYISSNTQVNVGLGYSYNNNNTLTGFVSQNDSSLGSINKATKDQLLQARADVKHSFNSLNVTAGLLLLYNPYTINTDHQQSMQIKNNSGAVFTQVNWPFSNKMSLDAGLRYEYSTLSHSGILTPRGTLNLKLGNNKKMYFSTGYFAQPAAVNYLIYRPELANMRAVHAIAGFEYTKANTLIRSNVFYKKYNNLIKFENGNTTSNGYGYAAGYDVFAKGKTSFLQLEYTASYSYIHSKRNYLDYPYAVQPPFVASHIAYLSLKRYIQRISTYVGASYSWQSGLPYNNPNDNQFMAAKTNNYNNANLTLVHIRNIKKVYCLFVFSVNNVFNSKQVFGYDYSITDPSRRMAVSPLASRFYFAGVFLNLGVNRADDVMQKTL